MEQGVCNRCKKVSDNLSEDGLCHDCERTIHCMEEVRLDRMIESKARSDGCKYGVYK